MTRFLKWLVGILGLLLVLAALTWLVMTLWQIPDSQLTGVTPYERLMLGNEHRKTVLAALSTAAQVVGGLLLLSGIYFAWLSARAAQENLRIASEGQVTERFTRATDQLGAPELSRRLGGIFALERIARDSQRDHWPVMEILASFVRERTAGEHQPRVGDDVQAAMSVIVRRNVVHETELPSDAVISFGELPLNKIDLRGGNFSRISFRKASMKEADLTGANLTGCDFTFANLEGARLVGAIVEEAIFNSAVMRGANLRGARGRRAIFDSTDLSNSNLEGMEIEFPDFDSTDLTNASMSRLDLRHAHFNSTKLAGAVLHESRFDGKLMDAFLAGADLAKASMRGVTLYGSLTNTILRETNLENANLENVTNLTAEQLASAITNAKTVLPAHLLGTTQEQVSKV